MLVNQINKSGKDDEQSFFYKTKIKPFLYNTIYETLDFNYAKKYIDDKYHYYNAGCTTVSKGKFVGRNLDWYYDEEATFVVRSSRSQGRYASVGTASCVKELTDDFANSNENSSAYKILPYFMQDGINEKSVYCNINVVPAGDKGLTSGTTPLMVQRLRLSGVMLVRYILDNFATAKSAVEYIRDYVSVYGIKSASGVTQEFHFLVRDLTNTYILEFVNNALVILSSTDSSFAPIPNNKDIMTNFYLSGWNGEVKSVVMGNTQAEVQATGLTDHAMGLERYNIASSAYSTLSTKEDMVDLMTNQLKYSKTYQSATSPFWHSEYNAQYQTFGNVTIYSQLADYQGVEEYSINKFQHRSRDESSPYYGTWHTAHTSIYDIEKQQLYLYVQEENDETTHSLVIDLYDYGKDTSNGMSLFNGTIDAEDWQFNSSLNIYEYTISQSIYNLTNPQVQSMLIDDDGAYSNVFFSYKLYTNGNIKFTSETQVNAKYTIIGVK